MTLMPQPLGLDDAETKRLGPSLTLAEARSVLVHFPFDAPAKDITLPGRRPFSASGIIRLTDGTTLFLKRHDRRVRDARRIADEHAFIRHLIAAGLPVSTPYRTRDRQAALTRDGWTYEAFRPMSGEDSYGDIPSWAPYHSCAQARSAGAMLARLHRAAATFDAPPRRDLLLVSGCDTLMADDLVTGVQRWVPSQPGLSEALSPRPWRQDIRSVLSPFHARLRPLLPAAIPAWGHGDWHGSNLFWRTNQVSGIFDFGMAARTCAAFDLAVAIERSFVTWLSPHASLPVHYGQLAAFLNGYDAERPLKTAERALIGAFLPLVHVEFALSEVAYYSALLQDEAAADIAYKGYLLGHARWFAGPDGRALLDWLRQFSEG